MLRKINCLDQTSLSLLNDDGGMRHAAGGSSATHNKKVDTLTTLETPS
jgi:hypothetical protein